MTTNAKSGNAINTRVLADGINAAWRETLHGIFKTGDLLLAAKEQIPHGQWRSFVRTELKFGYNIAHRLIAIARDSRLRNMAHAPHLPSCWTVLYELTRLRDEQFQRGIDTGEINPGMERWEVRALEGCLPPVTVPNNHPKLFPAKKPPRVKKYPPFIEQARWKYFEECGELTAEECLIEMDLCYQFFISQYNSGEEDDEREQEQEDRIAARENAGADHAPAA